MNPSVNMQLATSTLKDYLKQRKMRCTPERLTLLEYIMGTSGHFTVDEFAAMLQAEGFHVSLGTIYNTFEVLIDCGLLRRLRFGSDRPSYEKICGTSNHHHLICTSCGSVKELRLTEISRMIESCDFGRFSPSSYSLSIYGLCAKCQRRLAKENAKPTHN